MKYRNANGVRTPISPKKGFRIHLLVYVLVIPAIWLIWYLTDRSYPWPLWSTTVWGLGVLVHYFTVFKTRNNESAG